MALSQFKGDKKRITNLKHLSKSRPLGPLLKRSLTDSTGIVPGSTITLPITQDHTLIGKEAIEGQKIIGKYDLATRGSKKSRKKKRKKKKKSRKKKRKKKRKKSRKKHRRKSKKTRKKRGGADSLRDGIRKIYEGKKSLNFGAVDSGPGSWGKQLNELYAQYLSHLRDLTSGQKIARKVKNIFRKGDSKKPLTEGEADRIFYDEATNMIGILERNFQEPIRQSIVEINMNPDAMIYSDMERQSDPEKERLSMQILEERPRLESLKEQIDGSIYELTELIIALKRSRANSIPRHGSSIETNLGSMDPLPHVSPQRYRGLSSTT